MPFLITNVYHQWNTCNSYSCAKKSYGHQTTLFVGISGGSNISTVDHDVVYRDVITGSRESRDHHYDARLIHRILKSLLPQNNTFFIATASVVKDTADNPDCQGLRERTICYSTCAARCRLLCHRWIPLTKARKLWCFLWSATEQTFKQTIKTPVIWDAIALIMTSLLCTFQRD